MANPSRRTIDCIQRLYSHRVLSNPINFPSNLSRIYRLPHSTISSSIFSRILAQNYSSLSQSHNVFNRSMFSRFSQTSLSVSRRISNQNLTKLQNLGPFRLLSGRNFNSTKFGSNLGKTAIDKPLNAAKSVISRYREVVGLQIEAFWKRNYMVVVGAGAIVMCIFLWSLMFSIADMTVGISGGLAKYGFLALATAMVSFSYNIKLLAVDIPMASGPDQRLFVIGDEKEYRVGGGLISELQNPIVAAMAAEKEFDYLDEKEEEEDEQREKQEAERKQKEEEERALEEEMRRREETDRRKLVEEEENRLEKSTS